MARHHVILPGERRRRDLAAIHVGAKQLGLDEQTRRDLIERVTGVRSAADLDDAARAAVVQELRRLGAGRPGARKGAYPGKPGNMATMPSEVRKIEAQLTDMGLPWSYADSIAKRMFRIPRVAWLRTQAQLVAVLSALDVEQRKRAMGAQIDRMQATLGLTDADVVAPKNWRRSVAALEVVYQGLTAQLHLRELEELR